MNLADRQKLKCDLVQALSEYSTNHTPLPGIAKSAELEALALQIVDSIARVEYVYTLAKRDISDQVCRPMQAYDPVKAAVFYLRHGMVDEASWQVFLAINFGKHKKLGWQLAREVFGGLDEEPFWTWERISVSPDAFSNWLSTNHTNLEGKFGNHRKYESCNPSSKTYNGVTVETYARWVRDAGGHAELHSLVTANSENSKEAFSALYKSMSMVSRFGRTAKFDYLTMLAKIGLADLEPDKAYISGSTGPRRGISLLVNGSLNAPISPQAAEQHIANLGQSLPILRMVMQVLEDAICNWQKSPKEYIRFKG